MEKNPSVFQKVLSKALTGRDSHVETSDIIDGLDWKLCARKPSGIPHSLFQLANHMIYWQEWAVQWLDGKKPKAPKHAAVSWPGKEGPASKIEWKQTVQRLRDALTELDRCSRQQDPLVKHGKMTRLEMLHLIGAHNSYHTGQAALLRQMLGSWPPPAGGISW